LKLTKRTGHAPKGAAAKVRSLAPLVGFEERLWFVAPTL
jgi:hypothetical protein